MFMLSASLKTTRHGMAGEASYRALYTMSDMFVYHVGGCRQGRITVVELSSGSGLGEGVGSEGQELRAPSRRCYKKVRRDR